jgi:ABC-2 type transport system ATP-binding protein
MEQPLIKAVGLCRYFGEFCAVRDLAFNLNRGEILGLLGPNGAGKSTTLRMLSGALAPSAGDIWLSGVNLRDHPRQAKKNLGYLPETPPLYPELTVDEYLGYCARLRGLAAPKCAVALQKVKGRCGLADHGGRLIGNLSKGYRQRAGIAQAIIHEPGAIILDEPTSGLDPNQIFEFRGLIRELGKHHGIILSTHILQEVKAVCDRVYIMNEGRLATSASMEQLARHADRNLLIRLGRPPALEAIRGLPGVCSVGVLGKSRFRLELEEDAAPGIIAERIVNSGWDLEELTSGITELEHIFTQHTTGEIPS